jgi:hypothetical protein
MPISKAMVIDAFREPLRSTNEVFRSLRNTGEALGIYTHGKLLGPSSLAIT